jgi:hypothetical protein
MGCLPAKFLPRRTPAGIQCGIYGVRFDIGLGSSLAGILLRHRRGDSGKTALQAAKGFAIAFAFAVEQISHESPRFFGGHAPINSLVQATVKEPFVNFGGSFLAAYQLVAGAFVSDTSYLCVDPAYCIGFFNSKRNGRCLSSL